MSSIFDSHVNRASVDSRYTSNVISGDFFAAVCIFRSFLIGKMLILSINFNFINRFLLNHKIAYTNLPNILDKDSN